MDFNNLSSRNRQLLIFAPMCDTRAVVLVVVVTSLNVVGKIYILPEWMEVSDSRIQRSLRERTEYKNFKDAGSIILPKSSLLDSELA